MQSKAKTVPEYLDSLPPERRPEIERVRRVLLDHLDPDIAEGMQYGMIGYYVPHARFPAGYHCDPRQPLPFGGLAAQKNACSLYLMPLYGDAALLQWFTAEWKKTGKKLDMGKACIRFKRADDLALDVIAALLERVRLQAYLDACAAPRARTAAKKPARSKAAAKAPAKAPPKAKTRRRAAK